MRSTARPTLDAHPEAVKQAAVADRIVLTKTDLASAGARRAASARGSHALNPAAPILDAAKGEATADKTARQRPVTIRTAKSPT